MSMRKRTINCEDDACMSTKPKRNRRKSNSEFSDISTESSSSSNDHKSDDSDVQIIESDDENETQDDSEDELENFQVIDIDDTDDTNDTDDVTIIEDNTHRDNIKNIEIPSTSSKREPIDGDSKKIKKTNVIGPQWDDHELLAEQFDLELDVAKNIVNLFLNGNTIPFIARYRKNETSYMSPEMLRAFKDSFEEVTALKSKIVTVVKQLDKTNVLNDNLLSSITSSRSMEELEYIYAPYKPGNKRSLAERAKELGLEGPALDILYNLHDINLEQFDKKQMQGIVHIISSIISRDTEMLAFMRKLRSQTNFTIKVNKQTSSKQDQNKKTIKSEKVKTNNDETKFKNYFDFTDCTWSIKSYKVMAINRGEAMKILSVKVIIPDYILRKFKQFCEMKWINNTAMNQSYIKIITDGISDAYTRSVQPHLIREIRAELKLKAERASYEVFSTNLKNLLLGAPLKGKKILGIDPGFSHGCKLALVSPTGTILDTNIIYLFKKQNHSGLYILKKMLIEHQCDLIALGNGTACRETEEWLSDNIKSRAFDPLDVKYTIVSEDGASIYSCSPEAKKEFPNLDPNIISAVSLARRVQDPLAELVKIEPKHLGVGMYQHDLKKKHLDEVLAEVVSECVSFVGVDLNTTSKCLLKYVAGMSEKRAQQIIQHRESNGPFTHRKQLMNVFGIGQKIFEQCAGFLRVANSTHSKFDSTDIHPESYEDATKLIKKFHLQECDIGERHFIETIKRKSTGLDLDKLSAELGTSREKVDLILEALSKVLNYDLRITDKNQEKLFRKGLTKIEDLRVGTILTGRVTNVTDFGCFVDIGVGKSGLIHVSKFLGFVLKIGIKIEVEIVHIEMERGRIQLVPLRIL